MESESPASTTSFRLTCSLCGLDERQVSFSNRQRKKAHKNESLAKCTACVEGESAMASNSAPAQVGDSPSLDWNRPVPRKKKRKLAHSRLLDDEGDHEDLRAGEDEDDHEVSLDAIKRAVLGRDQLHEDTPGKARSEDDDLACIRRLLEAKPEADRSSPSLIAAQLQPDLECAICRDLLYPPVSLQCGHSFCQDCLEWWWKTSPTCPTCRDGEEARHSSRTSTSSSTKTCAAPKVNFALKKCIMALYAPTVARKIQTRKNATTGENDGKHSRGCEVLSPLEDEFWHSIATSTSQSVKVRRNIMLDEDDQRMQVAMALYQSPVQLANGIIISLCLLTMEEDEASDSGFPVIMTNAEDEHFICTNEAKFRQSLLQVEMTTDNGTCSPVARVVPHVLPPGMLEFQFDASACTLHHSAMSLRFKHEDTGAVLEIDLSLLRAGGGSFLPLQQRQRKQQQQVRAFAHRNDYLVIDEMDKNDEEGEDLDQFEDDGFLVEEETSSDVEGSFGGDDDLCVVCRDGGDLMVCDGGREMGGCGRNFHYQCVDRPSIPDGDWICSTCAISGGIEVDGSEGHEFVPPSIMAVGTHCHDNEPKAMAKGNSGRTLDDESSAEDEEENEEEQPLPKPAKAALADGGPSESRRRIVLDDSDDE